MATITLLKSKVHRATVTEADVDYVGSLTLDQDLMDAAGMLPYERIEVADVTNGARLATYLMAGERGSGVVCMNGAAALKINVGDLIIVFAYTDLTPEEAEGHRPKLVIVGEDNTIDQVLEEEVHGQKFV